MKTEPLMKSFITFSITNNRDLKIKYNKQGYIEPREIRPLGLKYAKNGNIILIAFDKNKEKWRSFSIDKIKYVKIVNE
jgi:predicted DNA-binding transcriptional regulator YafY